MAIPSTAVWEFRAEGNIGNGGFFVPGGSGVDYSQQNEAQKKTRISIDATDATKVTADAGYPAFDSNDENNSLYIYAQTGFTIGRYHIVSVASGVATLDRACGTVGSASAVAWLGGAVSFTDTVLEAVPAGSICHVRFGTYTLTGSVNVAADGSATLPVHFVGYKTTRGDNPVGADRPLVACAGYTWWFTGLYWNFSNIETTMTSQYGFNTASATMTNCKSTQTGATNAFAFRCNNGTNKYIDCEAVSTLDGYSAGTYDCHYLFCYAHDCGRAGFGLAGMGTVQNCIMANCQTGITVWGYNCSVINSTIYNNTGTNYAIDITNAVSQLTLLNNIFYTYYGVQITGSPGKLFISGGYNNYYGCTVDRLNDFPILVGDNDIDPQFTDATNGNFTTGSNVANTGRGITLGVD